MRGALLRRHINEAVEDALRIVLGRRADVAESAARLSASVWSGAARTFDRERLVKNAVERVRRHFGRRSKVRGDKYAKVAYAYFKRRSWRKTGLPESSFFHALKKVKDFFEADKHWTGLTNRRRSRGGRLE